MRPFERFAAGRAAHELALSVYRISAGWPGHELYGLTAQARRASVSIGANLAEGAARRGARELRRFLDLSRGSHAELQYLITLASDLGYISEEEQGELYLLLRKSGVLLWRLYSAVALKADAEP
jgi:four helix bundle protein